MMETLQFSPPKAAYFVGTYSAHSEPLEWRKPWNLYSFSELKRAKIRSPKIHRPRPPVDISFGRDPPVTLLNKDRPSSTAPPVYEINHEGEFDGKPKPSLGINEFSQVQQREPTAVNFGFLPVFPWPDKIPKRVSHLFPKSGENEVGWRVPQVDDRLSHFPHAVDNRRNIITTTMPPSTPEKNNNIWNPKTLTNPPTFPTLVQNGDQNFQLQFERDFKCRALDPFMDSVPHPHTDPSCEQGFPGWQKDPNCRCTFVVASRNFLGCATKFHTLCWRV
ncbi:hypothetical protein FO519_009038 [Halicephalobus sp. NKZ332]|nr:hypothetical protein FO519_009038 [Halicephalobus sp. NKZ332]